MSEIILDKLAGAIHERHGFNVIALDMSDMPLTMEVFLITSAENRIQARAISDNVQEEAEKLGFKVHHIEGYDEGSWILLDFVDLVIHIFLVETRAYYNLEMLWSDAPIIKYNDMERSADDRPGLSPA